MLPVGKLGILLINVDSGNQVILISEGKDIVADHLPGAPSCQHTAQDAAGQVLKIESKTRLMSNQGNRFTNCMQDISKVLFAITLDLLQIFFNPRRGTHINSP